MEAKERKVVLRDGECTGCGGEWTVGGEESLTLYQLCRTGSHRVSLKVAEGGRVKVVFVAVGEESLSYDYHIELNGEGADVELFGVFVAREGAHVKVHTEMRHNAPRCHSNQQVRGVAEAKGYGLFDGLVYVAPDAQQTEAYQQSRNVLLDPSARIQTQPQLEIYADDVKCSHGATVGQMNEEEIYYMRQRGLSEEDARRLQLGGFVQSIIDHVEDEDVKAEFESLIARR